MAAGLVAFLLKKGIADLLKHPLGLESKAKNLAADGSCSLGEWRVHMKAGDSSPGVQGKVLRCKGPYTLLTTPLLPAFGHVYWVAEF